MRRESEIVAESGLRIGAIGGSRLPRGCVAYCAMPVCPAPGRPNLT
jgi:hypothetical protein